MLALDRPRPRATRPGERLLVPPVLVLLVSAAAAAPAGARAARSTAASTQSDAVRRCAGDAVQRGAMRRGAARRGALHSPRPRATRPGAPLLVLPVLVLHHGRAVFHAAATAFLLLLAVYLTITVVVFARAFLLAAEVVVARVAASASRTHRGQVGRGPLVGNLRPFAYDQIWAEALDRGRSHRI